MTNEEFSNEFDILINAYSSNDTASPLKFDEYEKSVFLTKAQEEVVKAIYNGDYKGKSFEETEEVRRYINNLIYTKILNSHVSIIEDAKILKDAQYFNIYISPNILYIIYEAAISDDDKLGCAKGTELEVVPVTHDELHRIKRNPFRGANKRRVLRLDRRENIIELISPYHIDKYMLRYLSMPSPIILINLNEEHLSINGSSQQMSCKLNPAIHRLILETAVNMAIKSKALQVK